MIKDLKHTVFFLKYCNIFSEIVSYKSGTLLPELFPADYTKDSMASLLF